MFWQLDSQKLLIFCRVQPGAKQTQISGLHDGRLKIQLKAPPVDGKANQALLAFMSDILNTPQKNLRIKSGVNNRNKTLELSPLDNNFKLPASWQNDSAAFPG